MKSLWDDNEAKEYKSDLELRVYSSRVLGKSPDLVLHGGGNTSVKSTITNIFGEREDILYVKGSGWDLATIEAEGFAPVKMEMLLKLAELESLSDSDMVKYQRSAMINPDAPNPSIEAILHAILPFKFVDHTHADAVVALTNTPDSERRVAEIYGDSIIVIPYVMPGFILAKEIARCIEGKDLSKIDGLILMHHGVFTFDNDAKKSYEKMIKLVTMAEEFNEKAKKDFSINHLKEFTPLHVASIRKTINTIRSRPVIIRVDESHNSKLFATCPDVERIATTGPLTPDHVIRTKKNGVVIETLDDIDAYVNSYKEYFERHNDTTLTMLDPTPKWGVIKGSATIAIGNSVGDANVIHDIKEHTISSILSAESIEKYVALSEKEIFDMEYWELEQAKLKKSSSKPPFEGRVIVITNENDALSKAMEKSFKSLGGAVTYIDKSDNIDEVIKKIVFNYGGIDVFIDNSQSSEEVYEKLLPFLELGFHSCIVAINSNKNYDNLPIRTNHLKVTDFEESEKAAHIVTALAGDDFELLNDNNLYM